MRTRESLFALAMLIAALAAVSTFDSASAGVYRGGDFGLFGFGY
jgi:hypothetical protein